MKNKIIDPLTLGRSAPTPRANTARNGPSFGVALLTLGAALLLGACNKPAPTPTADHTEIGVPDGHTTENSVDWDGTYQGVLPCADCPGIDHRLTLETSGNYRLETRYLERSPAPEVVRGQFEWDRSGGIIQLDRAGSNQRFQVGEGRMWMLSQDGERITGPLAEHYELKKVD